MQKIVNTCLFLLLPMLLAACSREPALPDLSTIPWIQRLGYSPDEVFPVTSGKSVPGPQIRVTVEHEQQFLLIDVNTIDLFIQENTFSDANFEPQRMSNRLIDNNEIMVEEGYLHNVNLLNTDFPILYVAMIRQSSRPFRPKGIIGRNFLVNGRMTIDMQNRLCAFSTNPSTSLSSVNGDSSIIGFNLRHLNNNHNGLLKFHCRVNQRTILSTINTHTYNTQISGDLARKISSKKAPKDLQIESLQIGTKEFQGIKCQVNPNLIVLEPENAEMIDMVIGMDIIGQSLWTIDFTESKLLVE